MSAAQARRQAHELLAAPRYGRTHTHETGLHWVARQLGRLLDHLSGGTALGWAVLGVAVALLVGGLATLALRRRARRATAGDQAQRARAAGLDPAELERRAQAAEVAGQLDLALRLRFEGGLLALDAARAIELSPSLTSGAVARRLRSPVFAQLARTHDEVVYGGRPAQPAEVAAARTQWPRVLAGAEGGS